MINDKELYLYISKLVHFIYDEYDGNESEIYTSAYFYMYINKPNDKDGILVCFINAIEDIVNEDFNKIYNKIIKVIGK